MCGVVRRTPVIGLRDQVRGPPAIRRDDDLGTLDVSRSIKTADSQSGLLGRRGSATRLIPAAVTGGRRPWPL